MAGVKGVDEPIVPSSFPNPRSSRSAACTRLLSGIAGQGSFGDENVCMIFGRCRVEKGPLHGRASCGGVSPPSERQLVYDLASVGEFTLIFVTNVK